MGKGLMEVKDAPLATIPKVAMGSTLTPKRSCRVPRSQENAFSRTLWFAVAYGPLTFLGARRFLVSEIPL